MITFIRAFCGVCYESPGEAWCIVKLVIGVVTSTILGAIIFGLMELRQWIDNKMRVK